MALPENEPGYRVPPGPAPRSASTPRPAVVDLGNGYSIVYLELAEGGPQIVKNVQSDGPAARNDPDLGAKQAFEREQNAINLALQQARIAEDRRQYDETFGYNKARGDQQQQLAEGTVTGFFRGAPTLDRERFGESQYQHDSTQAIDYYKDLMNRVSNPRNFVQSYFERRGFAAPADAARYGNTAPGERPWTIGSLDQFLPGFLNTSRAVRGGAPAQTRTAANPPAQTFQPRPVLADPPQMPADMTAADWAAMGWSLAPMGSAQAQTSAPARPTVAYDGAALPTPPAGSSSNYASPYEGLSGFTRDGKVRLAPNDPDAPRLLRERPNEYVMTPTSYASQYASGGIIPEPVVGRGLISGQTYTFGEKGTEGVVPANMLPDFLRKRGGRGSYALGGLIGYDEGQPTGDTLYGGDPYGGPLYDTDPNASIDPGATSSPMPTFGKGPGGIVRPLGGDPYSAGSYAPTDPNPAPHGSTNLPWADPLAPSLPSTSTGSTPVGAIPSTPATTSSPFTLTPEQQAEINRQLAETAARNRRQTTTPPVEDPAARARREAEERARQEAAAREAERLRGIQQPTQLPQGPTTAQPVAGVGGTNPLTGQLATNRSASAPGTFGRSVPGQTPAFLAGEDMSPIAQLAASGALPPFVTRLLAQSAGVHNQSTSTPQRFDLPSDLPLISSLAYQQMLPSERAGLESLLSAYGIDPSDYFSMVEAYSPQGPRAEAPLFGARLQSFRQ